MLRANETWKVADIRIKLLKHLTEVRVVRIHPCYLLIGGLICLGRVGGARQTDYSGMEHELYWARTLDAEVRVVTNPTPASEIFKYTQVRAFSRTPTFTGSTPQ